LGTLGLNGDPPSRMAALRPFVDDLAVQDVGDFVAVADAFEGVPLADGFFDVLVAAEAFDILPVRVAAPPVDATRRELPRGGAFLVIVLLVVLLHLGSEARLILAR